ncbi:MAG: sodium/solute symporter [Acidobacteria bacterium]|nr:sodium/solute symporter [Acidobacteriota bacterium]
MAVTHRSLAPLDIAIIVVYFAIVFGIGFYFAGKERTSEDYFLASRNVGWFAIGASLFVSNISTEHFIGLAGSGATSGLAVGHFEWLACLILLILGWVFVPFYLRSNVFTMPEFLERRFNRSCSVYLASISILAYIFTKISVHLYAAAVVLERVVGWDPMTAAIILVVATGIYTIAGGLSAVIYTDLVQTIILLIGAIILTVVGLHEVGGFDGLRAALPAHYFSMIKPISHPEFPWTGIFLGAPILGIWYWCTDQVIVQRVLSAKDEGHAKAATIFAGFLKVLPVFILVLPGLIAFALYKDSGIFKFGANGAVLNGDIAYPTLIISLLPHGLVGVMIAALIAALMGAMSSVFNSASTLVTLDFYKKVRPDATEHQLVTFGRAATGILVVLGLLWVPFIKLISAQLFIYLQSVQAYISPPIAVCFIFGILWPRLNGTGAISSPLAGFVMGATRFVLEVMDKGTRFEASGVRWLLDMNFLHYAILMFVVCTVVLVVVSYMTPAPAREKLAGLTFATVDDKIDTTAAAVRKVSLRSETLLEHRLNIAFSAVLVATVVGLWIYFR